MGDDSKEQLRNVAANLEYFSLALDESTDISDTSQLLVFVRGVDADFSVYEESGGNTTNVRHNNRIRRSSRNNQRCREHWIAELMGKTQWSYYTDGAPTMVGARSGAVTKLLEHAK